MRKIALILILLNSLLFSANVLTLHQDASYSVGKDVTYFVDTNNTLSLEEIEKQKFTRYGKDIINFSFLAPTYWFKFNFTYDTAALAQKWWLEIAYPHLDHVSLYILDKENKLLSLSKEGDLERFPQTQIKSNALLFSLPNDMNQTYTLYLRVETSSSMFVPMQIISNNKLIEHTHLKQTLSGAYYGILLILVVYTLITFFASKERVYGFYVLYIISYALWQLSYDGLGILYLWGDSYWMREKATVFFIFTSTFLLLLFSKTLLKSTINIPRYDKIILKPLIYIVLIGLLISIVLPYKYTIVVGAILAILVPVLLFIAGLIVLKKDYYSIRLFVLGWAVFLIATILFTLSKFNIIGGYLLLNYGQQIGSVIELLLLSGALIQHFNNLKNEYTQKLKDHNKILKKMVEKALQTERNKDKILIEQSKYASMGEMIEQIAHQWRQPLNNIGLLNQDFYFKKELNELTEEDYKKLHTQIETNLSYMSNTIDDFRSYYQRDNKEERYDLYDAITIILHIVEATLNHHKIKISLDIQEDIYVYNIKNELFQVFLNILNNAKDALITQNISNKKISIKLTYDEEFAYIFIKDNGGGIPPEIISKIFNPYFTTKQAKNGTGIGLYMSKNIIEKSMSGKISVQNIEKGTLFSITLPLSKEKS